MFDDALFCRWEKHPSVSHRWKGLFILSVQSGSSFVIYSHLVHWALPSSGIHIRRTYELNLATISHSIRVRKKRLIFKEISETFQYEIVHDKKHNNRIIVFPYSQPLIHKDPQSTWHVRYIHNVVMETRIFIIDHVLMSVEYICTIPTSLDIYISCYHDTECECSFTHTSHPINAHMHSPIKMSWIFIILLSIIDLYISYKHLPATTIIIIYRYTSKDHEPVSQFTSHLTLAF